MTLREADAADVEALAGIVGPDGAIAAGDQAARAYLVEPRDRWQGRAAIVLRPGSTAEVAAIVRHCATRRLGIVPWSGGTGLVGGQVMEAGPAPVVLSLDRMNRVRAVLAEDDAVLAEAGVILADVQAAAEAAGRLFPLSLASEGSARVGGLLATNAGGVGVVRYGTARELCLGLEAVLPDGSVLGGLRALRKDNTGYDIRNLLIGAEGTLGIITAAALRLFPRPGELLTAMLAVPSPAAAVTLFHRLREALGDGITAFELMAARGPEWVRRFNPDRPDPLPGNPPWRVLLEASGPPESRLTERTEAALASAFEDGVAEDGTIAASEAQRAGMWFIRETIPEANRRIGAISSHDVALPIGRLARFIEEIEVELQALHPGIRSNAFGHIGDGNLHYNVFPPEGAAAAEFTALAPQVQQAVHDRVHAHDGSISAEHGIGRAKVADLERYADPGKLAAMRAVKSALDPHGIMNPGAVLAASAGAS